MEKRLSYDGSTKEKNEPICDGEMGKMETGTEKGGIMKIFILIIVLGMAAIGGFLGWRVLGLMKRNKQLRTDRNELIEQRGKQSDQLRQKGIEIDELKKELDKYSGIEPKIALTVLEKRMILNALDAPHYKLTVQDPKTNYFIRKIYANLKEKIKESIKK